MPRDLRSISVDESLDSLEDELVYTISGLRADPRAVSLVSLTEGWLAALDEVRSVNRKARAKVVNAEARRVVSNENLDNACEAFGATLLEAVDGDKKSPRWTTFFRIPVGSFVRLSLRRQVDAVAVWLESDDVALEPHREALVQWSAAASAAVEDTHQLATARTRSQMARQQMVEDLSREREALYRGLFEIAAEEALPASWPQSFFYKFGLPTGS